MSVEQIITMVISMLPGIAAILGLIVSLVNFVRKSVKEKNWTALINYTMKLMGEAEQKFETGADKKEWCMAIVKASSEYLNYPVDDTELSTLIDSLCDLTKTVNYTTSDTAEDDTK
jgi:hypothetical protein